MLIPLRHEGGLMPQEPLDLVRGHDWQWFIGIHPSVMDANDSIDNCNSGRPLL
jgi:hypothetical protein